MAYLFLRLRGTLLLLAKTFNGACDVLVDIVGHRREVVVEIAQLPFELGADLIDLLLALAQRRHRPLDPVELNFCDLENPGTDLQPLIQLRPGCRRATADILRLLQKLVQLPAR